MRLVTYKPIKLEGYSDSDAGLPVTFLYVSSAEAAALMKSLASQLETGNSNAGRLETFIPGKGDFTICVSDEIRDCEKIIRDAQATIEYLKQRDGDKKGKDSK